MVGGGKGQEPFHELPDEILVQCIPGLEVKEVAGFGLEVQHQGKPDEERQIAIFG